jgi:hypothetical protein
MCAHKQRDKKRRRVADADADADADGVHKTRFRAPRLSLRAAKNGYCRFRLDLWGKKFLGAELKTTATVAVAVVNTDSPWHPDQRSYPVVAYRYAGGRGRGYNVVVNDDVDGDVDHDDIEIAFIAGIDEDNEDVVAKLAFVCVVTDPEDSSTMVLWAPVGHPGAANETGGTHMDAMLEKCKNPNLAGRDWEVVAKHHELATVMRVAKSFGIVPSPTTPGMATCVVL